MQQVKAKPVEVLVHVGQCEQEPNYTGLGWASPIHGPEQINSEKTYAAVAKCSQGKIVSIGKEWRKVTIGQGSWVRPCLLLLSLSSLLESPCLFFRSTGSMFPSQSLFPSPSSLWCDSPPLTPMFHIQASLLSSQVPKNWQITGRSPVPSEGEIVNLGPRPGKTARKEFQRKSYCCWEMPPFPLSSPPSCLWQQQQEPNCKDEVDICWSSWKGTFFFPQAYSEQAVCHPLLAATSFASCLTLGFHKVVYLPYIIQCSLSTSHYFTFIPFWDHASSVPLNSQGCLCDLLSVLFESQCSFCKVKGKQDARKPLHFP